MRETLEVINQMQADGIIGPYAIGGAVGATYFLEPVATAIFSRTEYQEFARFLERRDAMDLILSQLDALQSGKEARD